MNTRSETPRNERQDKVNEVKIRISHLLEWLKKDKLGENKLNLLEKYNHIIINRFTSDLARILCPIIGEDYKKAADTREGALYHLYHR